MADEELYAAHWAAYHLKNAMLRECLDGKAITVGSDLEHRLQFFSFHDHILQLRENPSDNMYNRILIVINELMEVWELNKAVNPYSISRIRQLTLMQYGLCKLRGFLNLPTNLKPPTRPSELDKLLPKVFDTSLYEQNVKEIFHTYTPRSGEQSLVEQCYANHFKQVLLDIYKTPSIVDKFRVFCLLQNYSLEAYISEATELMRMIENEVMFIPEMPIVASSAAVSAAKPTNQLATTEAAWTEEMKARNGPYAANKPSTPTLSNGKKTTSAPSAARANKRGATSAKSTQSSTDSQATQEQTPPQLSKHIKVSKSADKSAVDLRSVREEVLGKAALRDPLNEALGLGPIPRQTRSAAAYTATPVKTAAQPNKTSASVSHKRQLRHTTIEQQPNKQVTPSALHEKRALRSAISIEEPLMLPPTKTRRPLKKDAQKESPPAATPPPATPPAAPGAAKNTPKKSSTPVSVVQHQTKDTPESKRKRSRPHKRLTDERPTASTVSFDDSDDEAQQLPTKKGRKQQPAAKPHASLTPTKKQLLEEVLSSSENTSPNEPRTVLQYYAKQKFPAALPKTEPRVEAEAVAEHAVGRRLKWSYDEEEALVSGIAKHGEGNWRQILDDPEFSGRFRGRTNVNLKDKCRNLKDRNVL